MPKNSQQDKYTVELSFRELCVIAAWREKYRFGEIVLIMRDGVPIRIKKAFETDDLDHLDDGIKEKLTS